MNVKYSNKLFETRDRDFDFCRSFLVVSMISTHLFQQVYQNDYNRRITFFVTIGFVLISGFVIGGKNSNKVGNNPSKYFVNYLMRFAKILLIFIMFNIPVFILEPERLYSMYNTTIIDIIWMVLSGEGDAVFSFDILPAIALTTLFSWVFMAVTKRIKSEAFFLLVIPLISLWLFEFSIGEKYISLRLLLVGIFGCLLGKASKNINWMKLLNTVSNPRIITGIVLILILYFFSMTISFWPDKQILLWRHLFPTTLLIFLIYILSYSFKLGQKKWVQIMNLTIGEHMLFSYIFHIGTIKLICLSLKKSLNAQETIIACIFLTGITVTIIYFLNIGRKRVHLISRVYSFLFGT